MITITAVTAAPAVAASATAESTAGGTAPACVLRDIDKAAGTADVLNGCSKTMRLQLIISFGPDGDCTTIPNDGDWYRWKWVLGSYDRIAVC
ncbi:hypothetical protein RM550_04435 [Streptomyces sp. DSM 41527]|uniref:Secreted protein n=1 Tax=Streptomyces mooreae TaxID=3075523 RepID=A0ABU2T175_9ACTN|nr:hypothetical protein [Streptomyces sp. DSM 41527]MDT0454991.1 hypothetical protein [Streptomyces sp. DSM 41527]